MGHWLRTLGVDLPLIQAPMARVTTPAMAAIGAGIEPGEIPDSPIAYDAAKALIAAAKVAGQPVMLDFYADWCVSCKEMEKYTFSVPEVQEDLAGFVLLMADVTANNEADQALFRRFGVYGPPTTAFFGTHGRECRPFRLVGFVKAEDFRSHLARFAREC